MKCDSVQSVLWNMVVTISRMNCLELAGYMLNKTCRAILHLFPSVAKSVHIPLLLTFYTHVGALAQVNFLNPGCSFSVHFFTYLFIICGMDSI